MMQKFNINFFTNSIARDDNSSLISIYMCAPHSDNMYTYKHDVIERYCRLSSILEIDHHLAQQAIRQASNMNCRASRVERAESVVSSRFFFAENITISYRNCCYWEVPWFKRP